MNIAIALINQIVRQLTGSQVYALIAGAVVLAESRMMPGSDKREFVISNLLQRDDVKSVATWLVNLAIEAVVAKLRSAK